MTGLNPGTIYYVKAYATNTAGTVYGDEVSFATIGVMELTYDIATITDTIELPLYGNVDVTVEWGDGNIEPISSDGNHEHVYASSGEYNIVIKGGFEHFGSATTKGINRLVSVDYWNNQIITSFENAFRGASQLHSVPNTLPANVTNTSSMFRSAINFNQDISLWNVSSVTNMSGMFNRANKFNQDVGSWDVSKVENMYALFAHANVFNQDISSWNVSKVINMSYMFEAANMFNQDIGSWDVGEVLNMYAMFAHATVFDQDIGSWDVSKVTNMVLMLSDATLSLVNYNSILNSWSQLSLQSGVTFDAPNCFYTNDALTGRGNIISQGWTINDAGSNTPVVTTQAVSNIDTTSATGHGNITHLGISNPTQHGVCWSTTSNPTTSDSKTEEGAASATGAFTSNITGLSLGTTYYVRAYATNTAGTVYGTEVSFTSYGKMELHYNTNLSAGTTIALPLYDNVDVSVDWGDDNNNTYNGDGLHEHTYSSDGEYDVVIIGQDIFSISLASMLL